MSIRPRLAAGETVLSAWVGLPSALVAETLAREPWGAIAFDLQHALMDYADMRDGIAAVTLAGKPALVRIALGDLSLAARALDAGAAAVIAPMINTPEDARAFVDAVKFPPVGARSWGPNRVMALTGLGAAEYLEAANRETMAFAMIETARALDNLDAILGTPGIDGIFVGPSDLSVTLSNGAEIDAASARVDKAMQEIARRAAAAGKPAGAYSAVPERARQVAGWGYRLIAVGSDIAMLRAGSAQMWRDVSGG